MNRVKITIWFLSAIFLLLIAGLFNLEVIQGRNLRGLGDKNCIRLLSQRGSRGKIADRNGLLIAGNKISYDLMLAPQDYIQKDEIIPKVARILRKDPKDIRSEFQKLYSASSMPVVIANNLKLKEAVGLGQLKVDFPYGISGLQVTTLWRQISSTGMKNRLSSCVVGIFHQLQCGF
ncbi:MAG: hypothetical protein PHU01_09250 [Desulfuromonadaceae bacterium]|nr:hypothetical protein [Desulfuromonadaceae bacterium]